MLHDPERHQTLSNSEWDPDRAADAIRWIVHDTESAFRDDRYWPLHPLDRDAADAPDHVGTCLYYGAAGTIWALHYLADAGAVALHRDYRPLLGDVLSRNRAWLGAGDARAQASYLMGDTPIRLMRFLHAPNGEDEDALATLIAAHDDDPARELMWGLPGRLLAAVLLYRHTRAAHWAERFRTQARTLWGQRCTSAGGCTHWPQQLYGRSSAYLGAVHGFASTVLPIVRGRDMLDATEWNAWRRCIADTLEHTAIRADGCANWPPQLGAGTDQKRLLQFCHGAPGIVVAVSNVAEPTLDAILLEAGEAIWRAGPLRKGAGLCHGTSGNGYAFLKLYRRSGEKQWLDRARAFAMHAVSQMTADAKRFGQARYSLWTGDLGLACYLWDCLQGDARFPTLDVFQPPEPAA